MDSLPSHNVLCQQETEGNRVYVHSTDPSENATLNTNINKNKNKNKNTQLLQLFTDILFYIILNKRM
jgi:hypothetical protein